MTTSPFGGPTQLQVSLWRGSWQNCRVGLHRRGRRPSRPRPSRLLAAGVADTAPGARAALSPAPSSEHAVCKASGPSGLSLAITHLSASRALDFPGRSFTGSWPQLPMKSQPVWDWPVLSCEIPAQLRRGQLVSGTVASAQRWAGWFFWGTVTGQHTWAAGHTLHLYRRQRGTSTLDVTQVAKGDAAQACAPQGPAS